MNKAIIFGLLFCLVLSSFGLAGPGTPQLVYGFIQQNDYPVKNLAIRVTNTDTAASVVSSIPSPKPARSRIFDTMRFALNGRVSSYVCALTS